MEDFNSDFEVILHAGTAKNYAIDAIVEAENGCYHKSHELINEAHAEIALAHQGHSKDLVKLSQGENVEVNLIMVHAQDHLATATVLLTIAEKMVRMYEKFNK